MDSRQKKAILADTSADDVLRRINYDFDRVRVSLGDRFGIVVRAKQPDRWVSSFIVDFRPSLPAALLRNRDLIGRTSPSIHNDSQYNYGRRSVKC